MATAGAVGSLALGAAADRFSPRWMMVILYLSGSGSLALLAVTDTLVETYLSAVLTGLSGAGINTVAPIMWGKYYGRGSLGSIFGVSRAAQVSGFAVGPLASGNSLRHHGQLPRSVLDIGLGSIGGGHTGGGGQPSP